MLRAGALPQEAGALPQEPPAQAPQAQLLATEALAAVGVTVVGGVAGAGAGAAGAGAGAGAGARVAAASAALEAGRRLLLAARAGDTPAVRALLAAGAPFTADWLGTSPLHLAAANDHLETVEVLLRAGVSRDARTKVQRTPLHLAAGAGHARVVAALLGYGAHVDCRDMLGMTPLHWAAERGRAAAARVLLANGADAGAVSKFRKTPLALAARDPELRALFRAELAAREQRARAEPPPPAPEPSPHQPKQYKAPKPPTEQATEQLTNISFETIKLRNTPEKKPIRVKLVNSPKSDPKISSKTEAGAGAAGASAHETAALLLQRHGITLLPHDPGSTVLSALQSGRTVALSDAGKLMLKESLSPAPAPAASGGGGGGAGPAPGGGGGGAGGGAVLSLGELGACAPAATAPAHSSAKVLKKIDPVQFQKVKLIQMSEGGGGGGGALSSPLKPVRLKLRARGGAGGAGGGGVRLLLERASLQRLLAPAPAPAPAPAAPAPATPAPAPAAPVAPAAGDAVAQPEIQTKSSSEEDGGGGDASDVATLRAQLAAARATIAELRRQLRAARPPHPPHPPPA